MVDYKVMDMPTHLRREALKQDPKDNKRWIRDESWYTQTRTIYRSLYDFLSSNQLLMPAKHFSSIDDVVIMLSDLNEIGQKLIKSGAVDRWLGSFDRPESKKVLTDVKYLEKALKSIIGSIH